MPGSRGFPKGSDGDGKTDQEFTRLLELATELRNQLHGFRELYDESDMPSRLVIEDFDRFVSEYDAED